MNEFIITEKQIEELNRAFGGMKVVTSWLSCYAIWDMSGTYPVMKSEHIAIELPGIVRCRDCKRYHAAYNGCDEFGEIEPDGFCAWGERRGDAE